MELKLVIFDFFICLYTQIPPPRMAELAYGYASAIGGSTVIQSTHCCSPHNTNSPTPRGCGSDVIWRADL